MIIINFETKNDKIEKVEAKGHANYSQFGSDIVCSAVSAVIGGAINNLECEHKYKFDDPGYALIEMIGKVNYHDQCVLETMYVQLKSIEVNYGDYVKVIVYERN